MDSLELTWSHLGSLGCTWTYLDSLDQRDLLLFAGVLRRVQQELLLFTGVLMWCPLKPQHCCTKFVREPYPAPVSKNRPKFLKPQHLSAKTEKCRRTFLVRPPQRLENHRLTRPGTASLARTHASHERNESDFPVGLTPPTSDIRCTDICIYKMYR